MSRLKSEIFFLLLNLFANFCNPIRRDTFFVLRGDIFILFYCVLYTIPHRSFDSGLRSNFFRAL